MSFKKLVLVLSSILFLVIGSATLQGKNGPCGGQTIATPSHFTYSAPNPSSATLAGSTGSASVTFTVTPPSGGAVFTTCNATDTANIFVRDITQTGDANGNPLTSPVDITSTNPSLASQIAAAFSFSPNPVTFTPGEAPVTITVMINNPGVDPSAYGVYDINFAAKDQTPGSAGIGVASGSDFILRLIAATCSGDVTKPGVTITSPTGDQVLGVIPVEFTAKDPDMPTGCGTGVVSMSAEVESALYESSSHASGFHELLIDSSTNTGTISPGLPVAAGVTVTADTNFTPEGGSGTDGTESGTFFTSSAFSGIGNYTFEVKATDGAGNTGTASKNFYVAYNVDFTTEQNVSTGGSSPKSNVHLKFTVNRSGTISDGAFMVDETVAVALRTGTSPGSDPTDSTYSLVHYFGCGAVGSNVQIITGTGVSTCGTSTTDTYQTDFSNITVNTYYADVWFKDVDGTWRLEGTSGAMAPHEV
jgi:hypothetical protein